MNRILLVDDDPFALKALRRALDNPEYELVAFEDPLVALAYARQNPVDLVIADYIMPHMDGVHLLIEMERLVPDMIAILMSATSDPRAVMEGYGQAHIYRYVVKPWDDAELGTTVADALNRRDFLMARGLWAAS